MKKIGLIIVSLLWGFSSFGQYLSNDIPKSAANPPDASRQRLYTDGIELFGKTNLGTVIRYAPVRAVNGKTGSFTLVAADIGLGNVPNLNFSNAANLLSGTIPAARYGTGTIPIGALAITGSATTGKFLAWDGSWQTPAGGGGGGSSAWGGITGTLTDQTDLVSALSGKENSITAGSSGQYWSWDKTWRALNATAVGLSNVLNYDQTNAANLLSGSIPSARFGNGTIGLAAIAQGGATSGQVIGWNGSIWTPITVSSGGGSVAWGSITGTLSSQTDLQTALNGKQASLGYTPLNASSNLSDLPNAGTARTNLGLGTASVLDVASSGNASTSQVVKGNDTRLSDARTPTTHTHAAGDITSGTFSSTLFGNATIATTKLAQSGATTGQAILWDGAAWNPGTVSSGGGGETNTISNAGTVGQSLVNGKVGVDLQVKGLNVGSSKVSLTNNTTTKTVDVDVVDANLSIAGSQLTGTIPAARMPAYTGDVTTSAGSVNNTIANNAVTNAKAAQMAANTIKGNNTGVTANQADLTTTQVKSMLSLDQVPNVDATNASNLSSGSIPSGRFGATTVPISSINATGTASSSTYLRGDGTWNTLSGVGETNTASNVGVGGVGIYKQKTGVNFDLRNINAGSNKIGVTLDAANNEVDIDVNQANLSIATTQITGTLQAAQFPAQTGDVTNTAGSVANTIGTNVVTNAKAAQMAANTVKMNATGSTANAQDVTAASFKTWLYTALSIPISAINATGTASSSTYLRGDGSWTSVPGAGWDITSYSLSALRAASPTAAYVYITDNGKQGVFAYNASNTSGSDNTGTVIVTANSRRYERVITDKTVNPVWFGATGDGSTNDNTAVVACFAVADGTTINTVFFPAGTYKINIDAVTVQSGVKVIGDNGAKLLAATTPTSQANLLTTTGNNVTIQNLEFTASTFYVRGFKATGGTNIRFLDCKATTAALVELISCTSSEIRGFYAKTVQSFGPISGQSSAWSCVRLQYSNYVNISNGYLDGYGHGIQFDGGDPNNYLGATNVPVPVTVARGGKYVTISNVKALNGNGGGIWGNMYDFVLIQNCEIENFQDVGIDFEGCLNSKAQFCVIRNCVYGNLGNFFYNGQIEFSNITSIVTSSTYHHLIMADIATSVDNGSQYLKISNCIFQAEGHISVIGDVAQIFGSYKYLYVLDNTFKNTTWQVNTPGHYKEISRNKFYFDIASTNNVAISVAGFTTSNSQPGRAVVNDNEIHFRNGVTSSATSIGIQYFAGDAAAVNYVNIERNKVIGALVDLNTKFTTNSATYIPIIQINDNIFNAGNWVREEPSTGSHSNIILKRNLKVDGTPALLLDVPTSGFYTVGQQVQFYNPTSSGKTGMVCVLAGNPGTWDDLQWTIPANGNNNLMKGATITASSDLNTTQWRASNLLNGGRTSANNTYGWSSTAQASEFVSLTLTIDRGSFITFNSIYLFPTDDAGYEGSGFPRDFTVYTSTDNSTWLSAYSTTGVLQPTNGEPLKVNFPIRYARYVKVVITRIYLAEGGSPKAQLRALEIY